MVGDGRVVLRLIEIVIGTHPATECQAEPLAPACSRYSFLINNKEVLARLCPSSTLR
jgi:hypothetical protein